MAYKMQALGASFISEEGALQPTGWEQLPNCQWNSINVVLKKLIICYNNQLLLPLCIWRFVNYFHLKCN